MINRATFGDMQGFTCKIAQHPTFLCVHTPVVINAFFKKLKTRALILKATKLA